MRSTGVTKTLAVLYTIYYFLTSNWILADFFISPETKNLFVGLVIFSYVLVIYTSIQQNSNVSLITFFFGICITVALLVNGSSNFSLIVQGLFLISISISLPKEFLKITLNYISVVINIYILISAVQYVLIYFYPSYLSYSYQVTSTGLEMNEKAQISHWIQYLGLLTNERYEVLGHTMPRLGGYLTEPSAVPNLLLLPKILLWEIKRNYSYRNFLILGVIFVLYRSGFVTVYICIYVILLALRRLHLLDRIYLLSIPLFIFVVVNLVNLAPLLLDFLDDNSVYGLENKSNTVAVRVFGLSKMLSDIEFWGNTETTLFGVGFLFVYLVRFGWLVAGPLSWLLYKLWKQDGLVFHLLVFAALFLGKGFSSFGILILIVLYVESSLNNINTQQTF